MDKDISAYFLVNGEEGSAWPSPEQVCKSFAFWCTVCPSICPVSSQMLLLGEES